MGSECESIGYLYGKKYIDPLHHVIHKNEFQMTKGLNMKSRIIKVYEEKRGVYLHDLGYVKIS